MVAGRNMRKDHPMAKRAGMNGTLCFLALIVALVITLAGCGGSAAGGTGTNTGTTTGSSQTGCAAGVKEINGVNTSKFCGPA